MVLAEMTNSSLDKFARANDYLFDCYSDSPCATIFAGRAEEPICLWREPNQCPGGDRRIPGRSPRVGSMTSVTSFICKRGNLFPAAGPLASSTPNPSQTGAGENPAACGDLWSHRPGKTGNILNRQSAWDTDLSRQRRGALYAEIRANCPAWQPQKSCQEG